MASSKHHTFMDQNSCTTPVNTIHATNTNTTTLRKAARQYVISANYPFNSINS